VVVVVVVEEEEHYSRLETCERVFANYGETFFRRPWWHLLQVTICYHQLLSVTNGCEQRQAQEAELAIAASLKDLSDDNQPYRIGSWNETRTF
jgi:hypothetical protein